MLRQYLLTILLFNQSLLFVPLIPAAFATDLPAGAVVLDDDLIWDPLSVESFAISPDGKQIAYVSRGAIWVCNVDSGPPRKLAEIPNTITHFMADPDYEDVRQRFENLTPSRGYNILPHIRNHIVHLFSLHWTAAQDGVVYTLRGPYTGQLPLPAFRMYHASLEGVVTEVVRIEKQLGTPADTVTTFTLTSAKNHVLISHGGNPLIWNVADNRARATCFDYLLPSSTSDRFLGIEIDSRELVLVDKSFRVIERFDVVFDYRRRCSLFWSPDEQFAIGLRRAEHPSARWEGFRVDLETGETRDLDTGKVTDRFYFSGRGGEVFRVGITDNSPRGLGNPSYGTRIEVIPDGAESSYDLIRFEYPLPPRTARGDHSYPSVLVNTDCTLFAMALPRTASPADEEGTRGFQLHLIDNNSRTWQVGDVDDSLFYSPFLPIAFADEDRRLIGRKGSKLISIHVESIVAAEDGSHE